MNKYAGLLTKGDNFEIMFDGGIHGLDFRAIPIQFAFCIHQAEVPQKPRNGGHSHEKLSYSHGVDVGSDLGYRL